MRWLWLLIGTMALGCASSDTVPDEDEPRAGAGGTGAGAGGISGTSGQGGKGGASGKGGGGQGGAGQAGEAGAAGDGGEAGEAGSDGGAAGEGGAGGEAGEGGAGQAGEAGAAGQGGAGTAGQGGAAGTTGGAAGGSGGTAGAGGGGAAGGGACADLPEVTVGPSQPLKLSGSTASSKNVFGAYCDPVGASGKDRVYKVVPAVDGDLDVTVQADDAAYNPVLSVATSCTVFVTNKEGVCANYSGPGVGEALAVKAQAGQPLWVYVDGVKEQDGAFSLTVQYKGGAAGAGGMSGSSGQGGASGAAGQGAAGAGAGGAGAGGGGAGGGGAGGAGAGGAGGSVGQTCAAPIKVLVDKDAPVEVNGSTAAAQDKFFGYCNINDSGGHDQVIEVTAQSAGQLVARAEPLVDDYDLALYGMKNACDSVLLASDTNGGNGACRETLGPGVAETLPALTVAVGGKVYLVVDTNTKNGVKGGPYRLTLTLQ